jgi:hypothetical protein
MLTGPARAGERTDENEIAHLPMFELRHLFWTRSWRLSQFFFCFSRFVGLRDRHDLTSKGFFLLSPKMYSPMIYWMIIDHDYTYCNVTSWGLAELVA